MWWRQQDDSEVDAEGRFHALGTMLMDVDGKSDRIVDAVEDDDGWEEEEEEADRP